MPKKNLCKPLVSRKDRTYHSVKHKKVLGIPRVRLYPRDTPNTFLYTIIYYQIDAL